MRRVLIFFIRLYQRLPLSSHHNCRFIPTCSSYAIEAIEEYGSFRGSFLALRRIFRCRPGGQFGYDAVPIKEKKS